MQKDKISDLWFSFKYYKTTEETNRYFQYFEKILYECHECIK